MADYKKLSTIIYQLTKPVGTSVDGDIEFYKKYLIPIEGKILEPCVGNGRFLIHLLKYGLDISGFDLSEDMIDVLKENLADNNLNSNIYKANILDEISGKYSAVAIPNGSLNMFTSLSEINKIFSNLYSCLNTNGLLIFDLIYNDILKVGTLYKNEYSYNNEIITVENLLENFDEIKKITTNKITYKLKNDIEVQKFKIRQYDENLIIKKLEDVGFKNIKVINDYNDMIVKTKTKTFICKK